MIEFENVYLKYIKNFYTLYDFNLKINNNTIFIGEPEDGTYAIMRLMSKIEKDYVGTILIDGKNIKKIKDKDLPIAYIAHNFALFNNKSVFYNLYYPLKLRKIDKITAKNKIIEIIKKYCAIFCDENDDKTIIEFLNKKAKTLTYQQKKFICLLRAIIRKPKYLLIENFFEDLDKNLIKKAEKIINDIKQSSIIIASEKEDNFDVYKDYEKIYLNK